MIIYCWVPMKGKKTQIKINEDTKTEYNILK